MAIVKGKTRVCQSSIGDFNVEQINGSAFYDRYLEFMRVFRKHIHDFDPEVVFAQPLENSGKGTIDWYIPETEDEPISLQCLKETNLVDYQHYAEKRSVLLNALRAIEDKIDNPQERLYFACALKYAESEYAERVTYCYDNQISFAVWGMGIRKGRSIETVIKEDVKEHRIHQVTFVIKGQGVVVGDNILHRKHGYILAAKEIPEIKPANHWSFTEWLPFAPHGKVVEHDVAFTAVCKRTDDYQIDFMASEGGRINGAATVMVKPGESLTDREIPPVEADEGYHFVEWNPQPFLGIVQNDAIYTAVFEKDVVQADAFPETHSVRFVSGENGVLDGEDSCHVDSGSCLSDEQIPKVRASEGYSFSGWDKQTNNPIMEDTTFFARYNKIKLPWYRRFWLWLTSLFVERGCLKWLLWLLLLLLGLWFLSLFFRSCRGCSDHHNAVNGVVPLDTIRGTDGRIVDNNGYIRPITGNEGRLPDGDGFVAPVLGEGGTELPIVEQPGAPNTIANRLFLFVEDENDDVEALALDFKKAYPGDEYSIIGFDREVKLLVVQIPESERDEIRQTINSKIPNHRFIVFDEEVYELNGTINSSVVDPGWHLKAIHLQEGWKTTKGSENVVVAVVDDGIEAAHPMFEGRIVDAYNVFTQNNHLSLGEGHGTHTAGLAVGSADFYAKGASGVAPNCKLMPIQVFDNKRCPLSALVAGVMYAVHHGADVVNLSISPSFKGLNQLPVETQDKIARQQFKNVERLWTRVSSLASKKHCILVFAAGNDDILSSIPPENRNMTSIVVAAVDKNLCPTDFTNYGPCSDISAPGKDIYSSYPHGSFQSFDGTSMAAPIVAGTIALMKSLKKDLTVEQARNVLYKSGADVYGFIPPMVLVDAALECVKRGDFSKPEERKKHPVPNGKGDDSSARDISEIVLPQPVDIVTPPVSNGTGDVTDYDEIRRLIKEYEDKIKQLKKQLPENQK